MIVLHDAIVLQGMLSFQDVVQLQCKVNVNGKNVVHDLKELEG